MKKNIYFAIFLAMSFVIALTSCSKSQDLDYKKACEEKDFEKAYQIVDLLKEDAAEKEAEWRASSDASWSMRDTYKDSDLGFDKERIQKSSEKSSNARAVYRKAKEKAKEAEKYVILQESMSVLESQGTNGLIRIVGIAKEHNAEKWLYKELLDIAKKIGDDELFEKLQKIDPSNTTVSPETCTITGILNGYFEVEDVKVLLEETAFNKFYIRIKRIKDDIPQNRNKEFRFKCELLDENGQSLLVRECVSLDSEAISQTKVGDYLSIEFQLAEWEMKTCLKSNKFRIHSFLK